MNEKHTSSGEMGFLGALTILFIALKLLDTITWSWWWVLSPTLIPVAIGIFFAFIIMITIIWSARN